MLVGKVLLFHDISKILQKMRYTKNNYSQNSPILICFTRQTDSIFLGSTDSTTIGKYFSQKI